MPGQIHEPPDDVAAALIAGGYAEAVGPAATSRSQPNRALSDVTAAAEPADAEPADAEPAAAEAEGAAPRRRGRGTT